MSEERIVFVGGGAAGATAALETRKRLRGARITVLEAGSYPQYSCCALPFVLGGEIGDYRDIILFDEAFYRDFGKVDLHLNTKVLSIDRIAKKVVCEEGEFEYDKLVIATGSYAFVPPIGGLDRISFGRRTFLYKFMPDARALHAVAANAKSAIVIGAGLVGLEVADALNRKGVEVTVIELLPTIMHVMVDDDMARIVTGHLEERGIRMLLGTKVAEMAESSDLVRVLTDEGEHAADVCVVASGVRAETGIARDAGLEVGHGIVVDEHMTTSDPDIYACGDCCEFKNAITGGRALSQLGSTAVREARVVSANLAGEGMSMAPTLDTSITRMGELAIASVGITGRMAEESGLEPMSVKYRGSTLPEYYPGGSEIMIKLVFTCDKRIVGGQIIGKEGVLARIDTLSALMQCGGDLEKLYNLETAYTPPISPTTDPLSIAAALALRKCKKG